MFFNCCGERDETAKDVEHPSATAASKESPNLRLQPRVPPEGSYATLIVKVECGDGLLGVDSSFNFEKMQVENTQDAFVRLAINEEPEFGCTAVQWKTTGDPHWDEEFSAGLIHPRSFLCVTVMDDDPIFSKDNVVLSSHRSIGCIEVPLWEIPRNKVVTGWFKLNHNPDIDDSQSSLADRKKARHDTKAQRRASTSIDDAAKLKEAQEADASKQGGEKQWQHAPLYAGRIKLQLLVQTTAIKELFAEMKPAPVFVESMPQLNVPQFLEDIFEVKRLIMERLVLAPIKAFLYAISWENPLLSIALVCWHIFVCYNKKYISASLWVILSLCFWHEIPERPSDEGSELPQQSASFAGDLYQGASAALYKPFKGAQKDGIFGLAKGMKKGLDQNIKHTAAAWTNLGDSVKGGFGEAFDQMGIHSPGMQEFQSLLLLKPNLADMVRGLQPTAHTVRTSLHQVDDYFYWADARRTSYIVGAIGFSFTFSVVFKEYMGMVSGYGYFIFGLFACLSKAAFFKKIVSAILALKSALLKPQAPFPKRKFFQAIDS